MKEIKIPYTYTALLEIQPSLDLYPNEGWKELIEGIKDEYHEVLISEIAQKLGLGWPRSGRFISMTVRDCLLPTIHQLLGIKLMGKQKANTVLLILTYLYEHPDGLQIAMGESKFSPIERLNQFPDDWRSIANRHWQEICQSIPKQYYKKTIQELANDMNLWWPARNWESWTISDCCTESFEDLSKIRGIGRQKLQSIALILIRLGGLIEETSGNNAKADFWSHPVISKLSDRKREIFERRLLTVYEKPTFEELGKKYNVKRQRIEQIEREIKKKIGTSGLKSHLSELLDNYIKNEFLSIYTERRYLLRSEVRSIVSNLIPEIILAISLNYKSIYKFLSTIAKEAPLGWYFGEPHSFTTMTRKLKKELVSFLPAPTEALANTLEVDQGDLVAISLLNKFAVIQGSLMLPNRAGRANSIRGAQCFEIGLLHNQRFWPIDELINKSSKLTSPQSQRLYQMAISQCSRLFASTPAFVVQLDHGAIASKTTGEIEIVPELDDDEVPDESEIENKNINVLERLLEKEWPITGNNIYQLTLKAPNETDLAENSLIPYLCSIPGCTRLAPGVYGPKDYIKHPEKLKKARKLTMSEAEIRAYCFARRSGEKCEEIFPLWDAHQEQLWFRKLQKKSEDDPLLRSFLSVAKQKSWPEQLETEMLKLMEHAVSAKFLIQPSWIEARSYNVPDLGSTLTALRYAYEIAPLSWIRANHITCAWQLTEESGVGVLICGLALGLLDRSKRSWWKAIPANKIFDKNWERIQSLYMEKELPDWNHPVIQDYFEEARELAANEKLGFVKSESLDKFINKLKLNS